MDAKIKVGILFGGRSPEHRISLLSAKNVIANIDRAKYTPILIPIDKNGHWHIDDGSLQLKNANDPTKIELPEYSNRIYLSQNTGERTLIDADSGEIVETLNVLYPVLHGTFGEDGSIQGLAKVAGLPCVGCGILGSAAGMDKDVTKRLLRDSDIDIADFVTLRKGYNENVPYAEVSDKLGKELFIKPANLGSSVGVSFVDNEEDYNRAVKDGFKYDPKVIVEEKISGREIECAVMGNEAPKASIIGEILPVKGWYTFENKYVNQDGAGTAIPAEISEEDMKRAREMAIKTYVMLECCGLTRVDMFLCPDGRLLVNEVNTLPGFTQISMFPKLWGYEGIAYKDLISTLIEYALSKFESEAALIV